MLSDVAEGNNLMLTRLTPVATLIDTKQQSATLARRQDFAAGGGQKLHEGATFLNTILDACSNQWAKHERGSTNFKWGAGHHWPPAGDGPAATTSFRT